MEGLGRRIDKAARFSTEIGNPTFNVSATLVINWIALVLLAFLGSLRKHPFLHALRRWGRSRGGTSATQRQKFHTDDANQCLHNKSGSHGVPNINLPNFARLLVDFGEVLCSSANELQQDSNASSREDCIPQILTVLLEILRIYI